MSKRKQFRENVEKCEVIAYWTDLGGVEVRNVLHTPDGIVLWLKANVQSSHPTYHKRTVIECGRDGGHLDNVRVYNKRLYMRDCIRKGAWV